MKKIVDLHTLAMDSAGKADAARRRGDVDAALSLFQDAFKAEYKAAMATATDLEPTRSILLRSAAALALECHELEQAERIIGTAFAGNPPQEIRAKLRKLFDTIGVRRNGAASGRNKAEVIRDFVQEFPKASPQAIADAVNHQYHIKVSAQYVSTVKALSKKSTKKRTSPQNVGRAEDSNIFKSLLQAKKLADAMGGISRAKVALDALAKLGL